MVSYHQPGLWRMQTQYFSNSRNIENMAFAPPLFVSLKQRRYVKIILELPII